MLSIYPPQTTNTQLWYRCGRQLRLKSSHKGSGSEATLLQRLRGTRTGRHCYVGLHTIVTLVFGGTLYNLLGEARSSAKQPDRGHGTSLRPYAPDVLIVLRL